MNLMIRSYIFVSFLCVGIWGNPIIAEEEEVPEKDPVSSDDDTFDAIIKINEKQGNFFEGDIVLPNSRNAIQDKTYRWDLPVPFVIHDQFSFERKARIISALQELQVRTCIKFVERNAEADYLLYEMKNGCYSNVGRTGGKQTISIGNGCDHHRTIIHETLHGLGFWHEQSRTDRDDFVRIVWEVVTEGKEGNFEKKDNATLDTQGVPYDYDSIMHYSDTAFSSNGSKTIIALEEGNENMGNIDALSKIDLTELNLLYECQVSLDADGYTSWTEWSQCDLDCKRQRQRFCDGSQCSKWGEVQTQTSDCDIECEVGLDPDCGQNIVSGLTGSVTSPLFPYSYKPGSRCSNTIQVPDGARVQLSFQAMEVEDYEGSCYYDFVHVYDGADEKANKIATYCSTKLPTTIFSSGNTLTVKFESDASVEMGGYYANYYSVFGPVHNCAFENKNDHCGWTDDETAEQIFLVNSGSTSSADTGPSSDHTFGNDYGSYLFLESSSPVVNGDKARIISPWFDVPVTTVCFSFWYNMYGVNIGSLNAYLVENDVISATPFVTISGDKGDNDWYRSSSTISFADPFKVAVEATRSNGYKGDIAIDDVMLELGACN